MGRKVRYASFAGGERGEILRSRTTRRVAALPEDQSFWDRGVASNQKVPEDIVPRVGSSRRFPGDRNYNQPVSRATP
jgi:hypothetical protein